MMVSTPLLCKHCSI